MRPAGDLVVDPVSVLQREAGIATVTIANRHAANALDDATRQTVLGALCTAVEDPACTAIVLTGEGDTFCAGGDLASMPTEELLVRRRLGEMHEIVCLLHAGPKPVVAAVDGSAFGSGLSLAAACDHVIATGRSRFGCSFGDVGLVADTGLAWTLPRRVGWRTSRRILLSGERLDAEEALRIGLVDELVPSDDLLPAARRWATPFSDRVPHAVAASKRLLADSSSTLEGLLDRELGLQVTLLASDDFAQRRAAFLARRVPAFGRSHPSSGPRHPGGVGRGLSPAGPAG